MAILYVAAEKMELEPFAARLENLRSVKWPLAYAAEGILDGRRVLLTANGAGPKLAQRAVETALRAVSSADLSSSKLQAIVSTGFCGGLSPNLRENSIVIGTAVQTATESHACEMVYAAPQPFSTGPVFTQDRIAVTAAEKARLAETGAIAVDMEAAVVAARAARAEIPFFCIKVVSDRADESFSIDLNDMRSTDGRIARGKIVVYALTHPLQLSGLLHLKRRSDAASKALGDFLVSCRILPESDNGSV